MLSSFCGRWIAPLVCLSLFAGLLSGCSLPPGRVVTSGVAAKAYMQGNPRLIENYGPDYTVEMKSGAESGEVNRAGKSGVMLATFLINGSDVC